MDTDQGKHFCGIPYKMDDSVHIERELRREDEEKRNFCHKNYPFQ